VYHSVIDDYRNPRIHPLPTVSNFTDALAAGARSGLCQLLGLPQYLNDMTTRLSGGTFTPFLGGIPNLWRNALCDTDAPEPNPPPFAGGQCEGVLYNVFGFVQSETINGTLPSTDNWGVSAFPGAIARRRIREGVFDRAQIVSSTGAISTVGGVNTDFRRITAFEITSITRVDGQPDNCGDPDPEYEDLEPDDVTIDRDITYTNSNNVEVTIPVTFVYARAEIDVDANVTIPFTLNFSPSLNITGRVNVDGTVNFNFGGGTTTTLPKDPRKGDCGDIPIPDGEVPEDPTDSEQPSQPDRDAEKVIKGVLVTVTALSNERASLIVQSDNPDIYAPSLGHVQFLCRVGETSAAWTSDQPVKNRRNLIPCPWADGAIAVRGTPQPGVTWTLTPITGYAGVPVEYVTA